MPMEMPYSPTRRQMLIGAAALAGLSLPRWAEAQTPGVLRIGMTAADIPQMTGSPDNGFEGYRFCGYTMFDALCNWDLSSADKASDISPGPRRKLGGRPEGQDEMAIQAAPRRQVS